MCIQYIWQKKADLNVFKFRSELPVKDVQRHKCKSIQKVLFLHKLTVKRRSQPCVNHIQLPSVQWHIDNIKTAQWIVGSQSGVILGDCITSRRAFRQQRGYCCLGAGVSPQLLQLCSFLITRVFVCTFTATWISNNTLFRGFLVLSFICKTFVDDSKAKADIRKRSVTS